eukprot:TRINITY_DN33819_c0_g1_i1.p1 TRINITY_DN33819_c0_g1~~TRINITY_DN33819_c0_g1_i1.p1  ORF type:complete len:747 (-),score=140.12 TRINITY_DN33819_c0_g1_i1:83-2323(-)
MLSPMTLFFLGLLCASGCLCTQAARLGAQANAHVTDNTIAKMSEKYFDIAEGETTSTQDSDWILQELEKVGASMNVGGFLGHVREFFDGLQMGEDGPAEEFVEKVIKWRGAYPKLAQRLRTDKAIVRSMALRDALGRVMEDNAPRGGSELVDHLLRHLSGENLSRPDIDYDKTLGTGSIAQVALFRIKGRRRLMKMTWPEDEMHYANDFLTFKRWQAIAYAGSKFTWAMSDLKGVKLEQFRVFLQAVLAKESDILNEFDLMREFEATKEGAELVRACENETLPAYEAWRVPFKIRVPDVVSHGRHLLEQGFVGGRSLEQLKKQAADSSKPLIETQSNRNDSTTMRLMEQLTAPGDSLENLQAAMSTVGGPQAATDLKAAISATKVYLQGFLPRLGCMLMSKGKAHADAHGGNLFYDVRTKTFWIIDWGAMVELDNTQRVGLRNLLTELARGELSILDEELSKEAELMFAGRYLGSRLCQYMFDPEHYQAPTDLNVDELKKSLGNSRLVLCLETIALASRMVMSINQMNLKALAMADGWSTERPRSSNGTLTEVPHSMWRPSLLSQWSPVVSIGVLDAAKWENGLQLTSELRQHLDPSAWFLDTSRTALMQAAVVGNPVMVAKNLNQTFAMPLMKLRTQLGETALHLAANSGHAASIKAMASLPESTTLLQERDLRGKTPLMLAVSSGIGEVVQALLDYPGANLSLAALAPAMALAHKTGKSEMLHLLMSASGSSTSNNISSARDSE